MKSKLIFAIAALLFCGATAVWLILYGKADNSLHTSALSWAFTLAAGVLAGVGFGAIAYLIPGFQPVEKKTDATS
jgi:hypothetical protein